MTKSTTVQATIQNREALMSRIRTQTRLPRSGIAALAVGALHQAALGAEFVLAGLNKVVAPDYTQQFREFVQGSAGASSGPLAPLVQTLVVPNIDLVAQLSRFTELIAGAVLVLSAVEVARRRFAGRLGAPHGYEPIVALTSAAAACVLAGLSLGIYLLQGGRLPSINPDFAFASPVAIELLLVPMALGVAWLELERFLALRSPAGEQRVLDQNMFFVEQLLPGPPRFSWTDADPHSPIEATVGRGLPTQTLR